MSTESSGVEAKGSIEIIDQAIHVLFAHPLLIARYVIGVLPFLLGLFVFWADMSRNPFAAERCGVASAGMVGLFVWMKVWQSVYAKSFYAIISNKPAEPYSSKRSLRLTIQQVALHVSGWFVLPASLLATFPFGWVFAYYQHATLTGCGDHKSTKVVRHEAWAYARLWPRQNHYTISVLFLFSMAVWLNVAMGLWLVPFLLKTVFGIVTPFYEKFFVLNTLFWVVTTGLTYLCMDPITKGVYVLRTFYADAETSGLDLRVRLAGLRKKTALLLLALLLPVFCGDIQAATEKSEAPVSNPTREFSDVEAVEEVVEYVRSQQAYAWRFPRDAGPVVEKEETLLQRYLNEVGQSLKNLIVGLARLVGDFMEWIDDVFGFKPAPLDDSNADRGLAFTKMLLPFLLVLLALTLGVLFYRTLKNKKRTVIQDVAIDEVVRPDLTDEAVRADALPVDEWMDYARELLAKGDLRLALRAMFLSSLACLHERGLISVSQFKTNRDYLTEVRRRGAHSSSVLPAFVENTLLFEQSWYGTHDISEEYLNQFQENAEHIRGGAL